MMMRSASRQLARDVLGPDSFLVSLFFCVIVSEAKKPGAVIDELTNANCLRIL